MKPDYGLINPDSRGDYRDLITPIAAAVWPEFMLHDPIGDQHWDGLFEHFPAFQFALLARDRNSVAGLANSVPVRWDSEIEDLPDEGWDWALIQSARDYQAGHEPNMLCAL